MILVRVPAQGSMGCGVSAFFLSISTWPEEVLGSNEAVESKHIGSPSEVGWPSLCPLLVEPMRCRLIDKPISRVSAVCLRSGPPTSEERIRFFGIPGSWRYYAPAPVHLRRALEPRINWI